MRQRRNRRYTDTATVTRRSKTGENEIGEPQYEEVTVASGVSCRFEDESTEFVREDGGERVNKPAAVHFAETVDVQEGDTVDVDRVGATFEVRGVEVVRDHRRNRTQEQRAELERAD